MRNLSWLIALIVPCFSASAQAEPFSTANFDDSAPDWAAPADTSPSEADSEESSPDRLKGWAYHRGWAREHQRSDAFEIQTGLGVALSSMAAFDGGLGAQVQGRRRFGLWQVGLELDGSSQLFSDAGRNRFSALAGVAYRELPFLNLSLDAALGASSYHNIGSDSTLVLFEDLSNAPPENGAGATIPHAGLRGGVAFRVSGRTRFSVGLYGFVNQDLSQSSHTVGGETLTIGGAQEVGGGLSLGFDHVL